MHVSNIVFSENITNIESHQVKGCILLEAILWRAISEAPKSQRRDGNKVFAVSHK